VWDYRTNPLRLQAKNDRMEGADGNDLREFADFARSGS
jgi:hypothetical protein